MNIALGALIIIILLLPGGAFIKGFYTSIKRKESALNLSFNDLLLSGSVISILFHIIALSIIKWFGCSPQTATVYNLIQGKETSIAQELFTTFVIQFGIYNLSLNLICFLVGKIVKFYVERKNLDIEFYSLRTTNYWYQIFSGRYLERSGVQGKADKIDFVFVDALTDDDIIYSGFLKDFHFSKTKNELETIILREARKSVCYAHDGENGKQHKIGEVSTVPGDIFILPAGQIKNINVTYFFIQKD